MRRLKDDAGLQILAAGLGLEGVGSWLRHFRTMSIRNGNPDARSALQQAKLKLKELQQTLRQDTTTARQLSTANRALSVSESERLACEKEAQALGVRRRTNSRLRMTSVPIQKLMETEAEIAAFPHWDLTVQDCARIEKSWKTCTGKRKHFRLRARNLRRCPGRSGTVANRIPFWRSRMPSAHFWVGVFWLSVLRRQRGPSGAADAGRDLA